MAVTLQSLASIAAFCAWTVTSFFCHKLAKVAIDYFVSHLTSLTPVLGPILVTACQIICCYTAVRRELKFDGLFVVVASSHIAATLATNTSFYMLFASSTMAVKLLEPITSAIIQSLVLKTKMSMESVLSMPVIITGAVLFVGDPFKSSVVTNGIILAFVSNVVLGIRNVGVKLQQSGDDHSVIHIHSRSVLRLVFAAISVVGAAKILEASVYDFPKGLSYFLFLSFLSGGFHVAYSFISTSVILLHMTVVGHAIANILKRVLVVMLLHVSGRRQASFWNWMGLVMCTCGLALYNLRKISSTRSPQQAEKRATNPTGTEPYQPGSTIRKTARLKLLLLTSLIAFGMFEAAVQWDGISIPRPLASFTRNVDETSGAAFTGNRETYMTRRALRPGSFLSLILNNGTAILSESALVSEILHVKPSRPLNATKDYGKNLRHGFVKWRDDKVLIDTSIVYQPERKPISDVHAFLKKKLIEVTQETDGLSPYLKTSDEVIAEAERVQQSLFSDLIGDKKYAVLIGAIAIENKGDSAITIGEVMMLEKLQIELLYYINVVRCTGEKFKHAQELVASHATDDVVILMHGGGNLIGYGQENDCREKAFQAFPKHKTIILSQSFFMYGSKASVAHRVKMYCCNPELTILLRDRLSLYIAKRLFTNGTKLLLAPDMAYAIGPISRFSPPVYDVVWLHRGDSETPVYKSLPTFPRNTLVRVSDWRGWTSPKGATTLETAHNMMMNGLLFLQRGRVVVTDRLHGHILCILLDIPHVLLDNADNKLSSYHNTWTRGLTNTRLTDNPQDAARLAMELLETYGKSLQPVVKPYTIEE